MSYDQFVFDVNVAPREFDALMDWYMRETEAEEVGSDPMVLSAPLRAWFEQVSQTFPPLNGPAANASDEELEWAADYNMRPHSIMVSFAWSKAEEANGVVLIAAGDFGVGVLDPQVDDGDIFMPDGSKIRPKRRRWLGWFSRG